MEEEKKKTEVQVGTAKADLVYNYLLSSSAREKFDEIKGRLDFKRECLFAAQAYIKNDYLQSCTKESLVNALLSVCTIGLTLNPALGYCYLVPRRNKDKVEACCDISYRGMIHIMTESGGAKSVFAHMVYENDLFKMEYGAEPTLQHVPALGAGKKGGAIGCYAVVVLSDGTRTFDFLDIDELNHLKGRSESGKKGFGAWVSDFAEMSKKSVIKRMFKYIGKTDTFMRVAEVIEHDNDINGVDFKAEQAKQLAADKTKNVDRAVADAVKLASKSATTKKKSEVKEFNSSAEILEAIESCKTGQEIMDIINTAPEEMLTQKVYERAESKEEELRK